MVKAFTLCYAGNFKGPLMKLKPSEVNHLRHTLAWMRLEYCTDESAQQAALSSVKTLLDIGQVSQEDADRVIVELLEKINRVPQYVSHSINMLTAALRKHDGVKGAVLDVATRDVQSIDE